MPCKCKERREAILKRLRQTKQQLDAVMRRRRQQAQQRKNAAR